MMNVIVIPVTTRDLEAITKAAQDKLLLDLHAGLVGVTPVDTGQAKQGWTVDTQAGKIENNVEHVPKLNQGHSPQAPAGFIETEIDKAKLNF